MWQPGVSLQEVERDTILAALKFFCGNRTQAARSLGISVKTVRNKVSEYRKQGFVVPGGVQEDECQSKS